MTSIDDPTLPCPICGRPATTEALAESRWAAPAVLARLAGQHPHWRQADGACPACVQQALLVTLLHDGDAALHRGVQQVWPLDAEAAFGALPTPLRLHADPRFLGRGITIAMIDTGFYPHPDLVRPANRIRAWVDATADPPQALEFGPEDTPTWPGWEASAERQWHGTMTAVTAAGNGFLSRGLYRGLAAEAGVVLLQVRDDGPNRDEPIVRALDWLLEHGPRLGVHVANLSLGGHPVDPNRANPIDAAVARLVAQGVVVTAAAGNDGLRALVPPATAPEALTVGGLDDQNLFDHEALRLWHGNFGEGRNGAPKPELVAPSIWVAAPLLPGTEIAREAAALFERRGQRQVEARLAQLKLITPHYQHVDGTSFAAPLVASAAACLLEANGALSPAAVREILARTAASIPGVPVERQGAGALEAGRAVAAALEYRTHGRRFQERQPGRGPRFLYLHDHDARQVRVLGSWNGWRIEGSDMRQVEPGLWAFPVDRLPAGCYQYKFLLDERLWLADPRNPLKVPDQLGGFNSQLEI